MGLVAQICKVLSFDWVAKNHSGVPQGEVKCDPGGGANITPEHIADAGDGSHPLPIDYNLVVPLGRSGRFISVGYADVVNQQVAEPGEKRIYGRDPVTGEWVNEIRLKNDGTIFLNNKESSTTMAPDGTITTTNSTGIWTILPSGEIKGENPNGSYVLEEDGSFKAVNSNGNFGLAADGSITGGNGAGTFGLSTGGDFLVNGAKITPAGEVINAAGKVLGTHEHSGVVPGVGNSGPPV